MLPPVEVIGRAEDVIGTSDAASQGNVPREEIEKRPLLKPGEILETVPGMIVTQHSGDGKANRKGVDSHTPSGAGRCGMRRRRTRPGG